MKKKLGPCLACRRGFHDECEHKCKRCHESNKVIEVIEDDELEPTPRVGTVNAFKGPRKSKVHNLKDEKSTGRKRAAQLYPINPENACDWQGRKNCGGGKRPIIGCLEGKQQHRHHGPVKKTTRNEEGNVHRICTACHIHWHELNDLVYDEQAYNSLPHDPVPCSQEELVLNLLNWKDGTMGRKFELASSQNKAKFNETIQEE